MGEKMGEKNTKKELIQRTYEIMQREGLQGLSIRKITSGLGLSSTALYTHFADMDQLIMYASVRFLQDYIRCFKNTLNENMNPLEQYLTLWNCFAGYAFASIPIYEMLFFGKYKENLGDTIFEYYRMFPEDVTEFDGLSDSVFFSNDLKQRDYMMLQRAARAGEITPEAARILSEMNCYLFHGMLMEHRMDYRNPGVAKEAAVKFFYMIQEITNKYRLK